MSPTRDREKPMSIAMLVVGAKMAGRRKPREVMGLTTQMSFDLLKYLARTKGTMKTRVGRAVRKNKTREGNAQKMESKWNRSHVPLGFILN